MVWRLSGKECGVTIHRQPLTCEIYGKEFFLAHGDGLGDGDWKFKLLRAMFRSKTLQFLFLTFIRVGALISDWNGRSIAV